MNKRQKLLSGEQNALLIELKETYGLDAEDVIFFSNDPKPFLSYEATCILCDQLTDLRHIDITPIESAFDDSLSIKCMLTLADGRLRSAVGVVNKAEEIDGELMSHAQQYNAASARAIRNALRTAAIDLIALHYSRKLSEAQAIEYSGQPKSNRAALLAQVHVLGTEAGLIHALPDNTIDKSAWHMLLWNRYRAQSSADLTDDQLADFAAFLKAANQPPILVKAA